VFRLVLDTSVIVAALRSRLGASNAILRLIAEQKIRPLATPSLFLEYEAVLKRPEQRVAHKFDLPQIDQFLSALVSAIEPVEVHIAWRPQLRDPADEMVLEAAINGRADALVTFNVRDFVGVSERFGLKLFSPSELLNRMRS
jgi:putative PIN family toxin of toxin-antitoxin system